MKFSELAKQVRMQTGTDEYTLTNDMLATLYNAEIDAYAHTSVMTNRNEHWLGGTMEMETNGMEVEIPSEIIRIHRIEVFISGEWKVGRLYNLNRVPTIADADLLSVNTENGYAIFGRKLFLLSQNGERIRISAQMYPSFIEENIFNTEKTLENPGEGLVGLPRIWHRLLKNRMAIAYKESRDKPIPLSTYEREIAGELTTAMRVAGIVDTNRIYKIKKKNLNDVYDGNTTEWKTDNTEKLLTDTDGIFLTI